MADGEDALEVNWCELITTAEVEDSEEKAEAEGEGTKETADKNPFFIGKLPVQWKRQ